MRRSRFACAAVFVFAILAATCLAGEDASKQYEKSVAAGVEYLRSQQADDGSFSKQAGPAVTALCAYALLEHGRSPGDPEVAKALKYLEGFVQKDGGIYAPDSNYRNYESCISILAFQAANREGKYDELLKKAEAYVKGEQWDETEGNKESDEAYGGFGYGRNRRPDLSNTQIALDALKALGADENDEAVKKALTFVNRCQNLESAHNTTKFAALVNDGGFYYTPAAGGTSQAGPTENGGLRSYASMTYAGLKSMIYAGVGPDDPRVKAAMEWLSKNYDLDSNPGMGQAGLYYYYHTFAKALAATGVDKFKYAEGNEHDWRAELIAELAGRQQADGSWVNAETRWLEGDQNLVTAYTLLALAQCKQ